MIEELATDKEGKLTFTADLPIGFAYYIKETSPAPGFAMTDETQEFTFEYGGAEKEKVSYAFTFEDEPTVIEITKTSLTDGKELEGAKLQVTDESGKVVDSWTSGKEAHIIKEALKSLPEKKRNVILLSFFLDMTDTEIAKYMNLVRSTIHHHRTSSLIALKKIMEEIRTGKKK